MRLYSLFVIFTLLAGRYIYAGEPRNASEILHELKKLQNSTRVLYLAAHPDDENTRMISWLVNDIGARTAYLSLTRGDGGQNLIGTELGAELGVLRTQELMQAREIDGGIQFFTRAVDFGYSKTSSETLRKWGEQEVLSDVVWILRKFRPDVIITRFPPDERAGHGHHTASAMLGIKAFSMAADPTAFPGHLEFTDTWQPRRIYWNASNWWNRGLDSIARVDPDYISVDVGGYTPLKGRSYNELASLSRTQHKSQGFGVSIERGQVTEYLKYLAGDRAEHTVFEGIEPGWERFGFKEGDKMLAHIIDDYDPLHPERSVRPLLKLREAASAIQSEVRKKDFIQRLDKIILASLGIYTEALAGKEYVNKGEQITIKVEALLRNAPDFEVLLESIEAGGEKTGVHQVMPENNTLSRELELVVASDISQPYWLRSDYNTLFKVEDQQNIGKPENDPNIPVKLTFSMLGEDIRMEIPLVYKYSDRVDGEIIHPVSVLPEILVQAEHENLIFTNEEPLHLTLHFDLYTDQDVEVSLKAEGWKTEPSDFVLTPRAGGEELEKQVRVIPTVRSRNAALRVFVNEKPALALREINYSHIEKRLVFHEVAPQLVKIDLETKGNVVGYIPGAGDRVAEALEIMGYKVEILNEDKMRTQNLSRYQAIVAGIRAYNTCTWLPEVKDILMEYVSNGGNYIVQYNTVGRDLLSQNIGPYPFQISRERVTEEDAAVRFLLPDHPVFKEPNTITQVDFEGWVQERGLYFADEWHDAYKVPIGWHDVGEPERKGGLLIADYGEGAFMYTGISFFRELPAGVNGAYRLLANMISYSNPAKHEP